MNKVWILLRNRWLIQLLVILLNPWWWIILQRNMAVGVLVFCLSLNLFAYFWHSNNRRLLFSLLILTLVLFLISVRLAFDESIFRSSALDIQQINRRHEFYARGLGKIYTNRVSLAYFRNFYIPFNKLQNNFFSNLDPNSYFFASHPRERLGVEEFEKILPIFLPFFLLGFFYIIYKPDSRLFVYTSVVLLVSPVISPKYNLGPVLFFPMINLLISMGIILSLKKAVKK